MPNNQKGFTQLLLIGTIAIVVIVGLFYVSKNHLTTQNNATESPSSSLNNQVNDTLNRSPTASESRNIKTYENKDLGILFNYPYEVRQEENIVRIAGNSKNTMQDPFSVSQWLEVFKKDKNETVKNVIGKQILKDQYSNKICTLITKPSEVHKESGNTYYMTIMDNTSVKSMDDKSSCPLPYSDPGNISFFLSDKLHPDMFIYVGGGHFRIPLSDNTQWSDTIRFVK